jgi:hypothetical protein
VSDFISFDQIVAREWERYFRNPMPREPRDILIREYPCWLHIDSKDFGPNFAEIARFVKEECKHAVLWREDAAPSSDQDGFASLHFFDSEDMLNFELRFGEITE